MKYERGDVVEAGDPFDEEKPSRPFVIVNTAAHPFDGEQYIAVTLTTQTWYEETVPLSEDDFLDGGYRNGVISSRGGSSHCLTTIFSIGSVEWRTPR